MCPCLAAPCLHAPHPPTPFPSTSPFDPPSKPLFPNSSLPPSAPISLPLPNPHSLPTLPSPQAKAIEDTLAQLLAIGWATANYDPPCPPNPSLNFHPPHPPPGPPPPQAKAIEDTLAQLRAIGWATVVCTTASRGRQVQEVVSAVLAAGEQHRRRVSTATLNLVVREAVAWKGPPMARGSGKQGRVYYATQAAVRPPTFVMFVNDPRLFPDDYRRWVWGGGVEAVEGRG